MKQSGSKGFSLSDVRLIPLFLAANLILLILVKYANQDVPLAEFSFIPRGNVLNFGFTAAGVVLFLIAYIRDKGRLYSKRNFLLMLNFAGAAFLIAGRLIIISGIDPRNFYIFGYPAGKWFIALILFTSQVAQLILIAMLFVFVFSIKKMVLFRVFLFSMVQVLALFIYALLTVTSDSYYELNTLGTNKASYGIVLGAAVWKNNQPSPSLKARVDKAYELYKTGAINKIQLTGSNAPGEIAEADAAFQYIKKYPVTLNDVDVERKTTSTTEQIAFIKNELWDKKGELPVVIISDRYHLNRVLEIGIFYNVAFFVQESGQQYSIDKRAYYTLRETSALLTFWLFGA